MNTENSNIVSNGSSNGLSNDAALITDQSPDGIFSYDNRVPFWWKFLFVASVVFAPVYMLFFYSGIPGRSVYDQYGSCLLYTSPSPRDQRGSRMPSSA